MTLGDGATTTLHVASYERSAFDVRVDALEEPAPLVRWCGEKGVRQAVVGGFFVRPDYAPLGQVRIAGEAAAVGGVRGALGRHARLRAHRRRDAPDRAT